MYVTRPLSLYYNFPNAVTEAPPDGPHSGILVIEDAEAEERGKYLWGLFKSTRLFDVPFPQNKMIKVRYTTVDNEGVSTDQDDAYFIPVVGHPLSSSQYYVITAHGKYKGKACTCSREEDMSTFCLCSIVNDLKPSPFDHRNIYQQVRLISHKNKFRAVSVASDGIPQRFLRHKGWRVHTSKPSHYNLNEAHGINTSHRTQMPKLDFPISTKYSPSLMVGKWYCPYIFIKEGGQVKDQMMRSMFYEMTLEQYWEEVFTSENPYGDMNIVKVDASIKRESALLNGSEIVNENLNIVDEIIWFKPINSVGNGLGLCLPIWERIRWEEERGGYVGSEMVERVTRTELYEGKNGWKKFGCYVLVEKFVLRRMDRSLALSYEFKHSNKIRVKWE